MKKAPTQCHELETPFTMSAGQLEKFARFLEMHPGFYPELIGESGEISGFRVGGCFLSVREMNEFIASQPHFTAHEAALLLTPQRPATGGCHENPRRA
jgi:hypothetical protein